MMHVRRFLLVFTVVTLLLVSCTTAATPTTAPVTTTGGEPTQVVFWHIFGSGPSRDMLDKIIADFNAQNTDYVVEGVFTDFWTYDQEVLAAIAAGEPPDVIMADQTRAGQRAEAQQIISLSQYFTADGMDLSSFWEYPQSDVTYKGEIWGVPFAPDTRILYYNKALFTEAGLDPETPPTTWDELWEFAQQLDQKDAQDNLTRIGFSPMLGNVYVLPFLYTNGAELVDEEGNFLFTAPEVVETAQWYKQWVDHYGKDNLDTFASGFGTGAQDPFMSGQVAMIIQTQDFIGQLKTYVPDMDWGAALIPYNAGPASWGAGFDLEIPNGAANPEGAWAFIKYLTSKDVQVAWALASGWMPSAVAAAEDPQLATSAAWAVVLESMKVTRSRRFVLEAPTWYIPLITAFQEVWDGVKTPEQALADAQSLVETEVENFRSTQK